MSKDSTIDKCNFCFLAEELDSEKIQYWSKKRENYSPYPKMVSCDENYSLKNDELKELEPELGDNPLHLKLTLGEEYSGRHVYYWAANESENIHNILPPESAYGEYEIYCTSHTEVLDSIYKRFQRVDKKNTGKS